MCAFKKTWIWFFMLSKRLYKKPSFLLILLLIPVTVFAYGKVAQEDSGVMTIVIAAEDPQDPVAKEVISNLYGSSALIRYVLSDSVENATEQVRMYQADAAWIFPADMGEKIHEFVTADRRQPVIQVIVREKNVALMLSNEKLSGTMFQYCARAYYLHYLREKADVLDVYSDEELLAFYDDALVGDQLFSFTNAEGSIQDSAQYNYLLTPIRGLLGIIIVLCGLATAMYYTKDNSAGLFAYLSEGKKSVAEAGYQAVSLLNISVVVLSTLLAVGISVNPVREISLTLGYILCTLSFCLLIRVLCGSLRGLGTAMVLLVVVMIAVCPVFYDLAILRDVQYLLPPTYFVNAAYADSYMMYMFLYSGVCFGLSWLIGRVLKRY